MDMKERVVPIALLVSGIGLLVVASFTRSEELTPLGFLIAHTIVLVFGVAVGVVACYITASLMDTSFGFLSSAILKLAGIFVFTTALGTFLTFGAWFITLPVYLILLMWLFELEWVETVVFAVVLWIVRLVALIVVLTAVLSLLGLIL